MLIFAKIHLRTMSVLKKLSPFYNLTLFYVLVSFILRIVLLFHPITQASFSSLDTIKIFTFITNPDIIKKIFAQYKTHYLTESESPDR